MSTHLQNLSTSMTESYSKMLLSGPKDNCGESCMQNYYDTLHRFSLDITKFDIEALQGGNEKIMKEAHNLAGAIDQLKGAALNDDSYSVVFNAINHCLQIIESFLPVTL